MTLLQNMMIVCDITELIRVFGVWKEVLVDEMYNKSQLSDVSVSPDIT